MKHAHRGSNGYRIAGALAATVVALAGLISPIESAQAQPQGKLKVGLMLPYTGTYAALGNSITNAFKLRIEENGGRVGGREVEYFVVDDESDPAKAPDNANKLIKRDNVDVLVGTVHSGVALAMAKVARDNNTLLIIPNAGADEITGPLCAANIFRTSFSNSQPGIAMGRVMAEQKKKTAVTFTWNYAAGAESVGGFKEAFEAGGGKVIKELALPFPQVEFQSYLTEIAALKPDVVYVFFAGAGAVKFVKDYAAAGLNKTIPLVGPGFLTDGTLEAQGDAAQGLLTTLHYGDGLNNPKNIAFRAAYQKAYKTEPDVYAVQGYDAAQLLIAGMNAVKGDTSKRAELVKAMESAKIESPRGPFALTPSHNPIHDIYLRKVEGKENKVIGVAVKNLTDPPRGCKL
ncbi:MAG TPA: ABC transporter substrate-binding protein [Casimicrobiaceae bacterium]|jgi:branched-chain amino acid transport system substrate-binding protein|nr:ABC transporter substrate-binding protein [Casimicrobiaceae bacterium]